MANGDVADEEEEDADAVADAFAAEDAADDAKILRARTATGAAALAPAATAGKEEPVTSLRLRPRASNIAERWCDRKDVHENRQSTKKRVGVFTPQLQVNGETMKKIRVVRSVPQLKG